MTHALITQFWQLMSSNDFHSVSAVLAEDFILEWPQSNERIRGASHFAMMNSEYPAHGPWTFTIKRIITQELAAVSEVFISDGVQTATAISFFTIVNGKISRLIEYWPMPYLAPSNRAQWVEPIIP